MIGLADGEWHRLHPLTPLLRGGLGFIAVIGIIIANLRERLVEWFLPGLVCPPGEDCGQDDPIGYVVENGYAVIGLAALLGVLLLFVAGFYVSWRMHTFRITDEVVEVRSGILFRTHRKARLDRIQGVAIARPLFARIFGTAKLEVEVAGQDANVPLAYLGNAASDALRGDILRLASGSRVGSAASSAGAASGSLIDRRVSELLAPELDPSLAPPESVVRMHPGRLIGSTLLSGTTLSLLIILAAAITGTVFAVGGFGELIWTLFTLIPIAFGLASYQVNRVLKFLRYSIAATPDGVRIGYGLLSTRNETVPPGRIHSVAVSQSIFWRPADWWTIRINRASRQTSSDGSAQQNTVVLPVGSRDDVFRVLDLVLPGLVADGGDTRELLERGLAGSGPDADFTTSPRRAALVRWFSWRRNGFAILPGAVLLRRGAIWRELAIVPTPRVQSVAIEQGPIYRGMRLVHVHVHTVAGPISPALGALDAKDAEGFFRDAAVAAVAAAGTDTSHRWRSSEK
ncbi:PH domain-containing protein [Pseudolysinimonas sp.]|uniref:PH domain-containing protein n=1 Tax=Pseudolysinimonas sp. TaxID=2680009 RepID=UPI00286A5C08|nr:PH domain-containing protein [Pseudolysinimonas sp.]